MSGPLVSVICLSYNHERFIREAVASVLAQTYPYIELIIVDDSSKDGSQNVIRELVAEHPQIRFHITEKNSGNCRAFNEGLALSSGQYVVDFAADDVFFPTRIEDQVRAFSELPADYGVVFTDAVYIDESGSELYRHEELLRKRGLLENIPSGNVYADVLSRYFIAAPTMLVRRSVFDEIKGYDETLAYEDFDFWVRSSRLFRYAYIPRPLTKIRRQPHSLSTKQYQTGDRQLHSTYLVCRKAQTLNRTAEEKESLIQRVRYELRHASLTGNAKEASLFYDLLCELTRPHFWDNVWLGVGRSGIRLKWLRALYHRFRYS